MSFLPATDDPGPENAGGRVVLWLLFLLLVLVAGAYVAAHFIAGDNVPRGTTVSGVKIGGHPQDEAAGRLRAGLADRATAPISAVVGGETIELKPGELGLDVDYEASVAEAGGANSWDPKRLWRYFTGGEDTKAEVTVDDAALGAQLAALDKEYGKSPREGAVAFDGNRIVTTEPRVGRQVDPTAAREALVEAYLDSDEPTVELTLIDAQPEIDQADVDQARNEFANRAVADSVTLSFDKTSVKLFPKDYTRALTMEPVNGELVPRLDAKVLDEVVSAAVGENGTAVDATVQLVNGVPKVIRARPGVTYDKKQVADGFLTLVVAERDQRSLQVAAKVAQPDFTTKDARALAIKERVSTFTTYYPHAEYRNVNLGRAAELINGTVLKPGETFSLNGTVGERTRANGFTKGYVISDGILVGDLGGGVSQMATTTFNAMFFAGLEDVEHKPHSFYIDRYPIGREATVAWGSVDLKFKNDTPYGVLIAAAVTPSTVSSSGVVTVSMYSTKHWNITTSESDRYNLTEPKVRKVDTKECHANEGYGGFDIDVTRYFDPVTPNTESRSPEVFTTTYTPSDTVICTHPNPEDNVS